MIGKSMLIAATFLVGGSASSGSQQPTLREVAQARGGTASRTVFLEFPVMEWHDLVAGSDLIVHAKTVDQRTTLNRDQTLVMTEYTLEPLRIPLARSSASLTKPGQLKITVRRPGGKLSIDGLSLSTDVDAYSDDAALKTGEVALFFLTHDKDEGVYYPVGGPFGILRITAGKTRPLTASVARRRGDKPTDLNEVFATVERLGAAEVRR